VTNLIILMHIPRALFCRPFVLTPFSSYCKSAD